MIDIAELQLITATGAERGSLLIESAKRPMYAAILTIGGTDDHDALTFGDRHGFQVVSMARVGRAFVKVDSPRFVLDPASSVSGSDHSPDPGTLFLAPAGPGILARAGHAEVGVLLSGQIVDIDYGNFAGFRHWRIEVGDNAGEPHVLFSYRHASFLGDESLSAHRPAQVS